MINFGIWNFQPKEKSHERSAVNPLLKTKKKKL
jgi:hypothetical protein